MELAIIPASDQHPLTRSEAESIQIALREQGIEVALVERKPQLGELALFDQLWTFVLAQHVPVGLSAVALSAWISKILAPSLKSLDVWNQQKVTIKVGGLSVTAPANLPKEELATLVDRVVAASVAANAAQKGAAVKKKRTGPKKAARSKRSD